MVDAATVAGFALGDVEVAAHVSADFARKVGKCKAVGLGYGDAMTYAVDIFFAAGNVIPRL